MRLIEHRDIINEKIEGGSYLGCKNTLDKSRQGLRLSNEKTVTPYHHGEIHFHVTPGVFRSHSEYSWSDMDVNLSVHGLGIAIYIANCY